MILLRHCQSLFNQAFTRERRDPGIPDPSLTDLGLAQASDAADRLCGPDAAPIVQLLVTPYRRALQTAAPIAARLGLVPSVVPLARERFAFSCDIGSSPMALAREWPALDFSGLTEDWWQPGADQPGQPESEASILDRAERFRVRMCADPLQQRTLLVSHWGFLLTLSRRSLENGQSITHDPAQRHAGPIVWSH